MYRIYSDDLLIYDPNLEEYEITKGELIQELNTSGSLSFTVSKDHPHYGMIDLMKSIVTLYDDNRLIFRGRPYSPTINLYEHNNIYCEGDFAFFNDTYYPNFEFFGTPEELFTQLVEFHNTQVSEEKRFIVGNVTVTSGTQDGNIVRSSENYMTTMDALSDKLFNTELGGYIWIRHEQGGNYVDYLSDLNYLGRQPVEQCINLIEAQKVVSPENLATVVIPLGALIKDEEGQETGVRTTIESVNEGRIYLESAEGISLYGRITKVVEHDDITEPSNLLVAGRRDLAEALGVTTSVSLSAADLSKAGFDVNPFVLGTYVETKIKNLDVDGRMLVRGLKINLLEPESNSLDLGDSKRSLTGSQLKTNKTIGLLRNEIAKNLREQQQMAVELRRETASSIQQASDSITTMVSENYYNIAQSDELYSSISTIIQQTASEILFQFNEFKTDQEITDDQVQETFEEWRRYIRFVNGAIELGLVGNPLGLKLQNDIIQFLENGAATSYWQNSKFYTTDGEFLNSLQLGNFAFIPRESGNLSFLKNR